MKADCAYVLLLDRDKAESREPRHALSGETSGFKHRADVANMTSGANETAAEAYGRYNPNFEDTAYMVLAGLSAIIEKIERIENTDPAVLERLDKGLIAPGDADEELSLDQVSAVERLVLSLITDRAKAV